MHSATQERRRKFYGWGYECDEVSPQEIAEFEKTCTRRVGQFPIPSIRGYRICRRMPILPTDTTRAFLAPWTSLTSTTSRCRPS
jgi:hypothetical protein